MQSTANRVTTLVPNYIPGKEYKIIPQEGQTEEQIRAAFQRMTSVSFPDLTGKEDHEFFHVTIERSVVYGSVKTAIRFECAVEAAC